MSTPKAPLKDDLVQLFANATVRTLQVQCKLDTKAKSAFIKGEHPQSPFEIGGLIGVTSSELHGTAALLFPKAVYIQILHGLLNESATEITADNQDAAAELLNIIFSHVKTILNKKGHDLKMAIPSVIRGDEIESKYAKGKTVHVIEFETPVGAFFAEILLVDLLQQEKVDTTPTGAEPQTMSAAEKAAFFIPFLNGTVKTLQVQLGLQVKTGKPFDKIAQYHYPFDIAGAVGITSKTVNGSYLIVFKQEVFLKLASKMFNEEITTLQPGLEDLVAELVNMSLGVAKKELNEKGHGVQMAIPTVIKGSNIQASVPKDRRVIVIPFQTDIGDFHVEIDIQS